MIVSRTLDVPMASGRTEHRQVSFSISVVVTRNWNISFATALDGEVSGASGPVGSSLALDVPFTSRRAPDCEFLLFVSEVVARHGNIAFASALNGEVSGAGCPVRGSLTLDVPVASGGTEDGQTSSSFSEVVGRDGNVTLTSALDGKISLGGSPALGSVAFNVEVASGGTENGNAVTSFTEIIGGHRDISSASALDLEVVGGLGPIVASQALDVPVAIGGAENSQTNSITEVVARHGDVSWGSALDLQVLSS